MVDPVTQDLYLMQNEYGLIKIGRSIDAQQRRWNLSVSERCKVQFVLRFECAGDAEEFVHFRLQTHRIDGEWFSGTDEARAAVQAVLGEAFGNDKPIEWAVPYDAIGARRWVNHIESVRKAERVSRKVYRFARILDSCDRPGYMLDWEICELALLARTGQRLQCRRSPTNNKIIEAYDEAAEAFVRIPSYTSDTEAALSLWPEDLRPSEWHGRAIECCAEALRALRLRMPKVPRLERG